MSASLPLEPEVKKKFFITHIGWVTVNNYGTVEFELPGFLGGEPRKVIWAADTLHSVNREVRASIAEMRKEKVYAR
jgi:hypothetical protein